MFNLLKISPLTTLDSGFFVIPLYIHGHTARPVVILLSGALAIISAAEILRFRNAGFERVYERIFGPLMRESEKVGRVTPLVCLSDIPPLPI